MTNENRTTNAGLSTMWALGNYPNLGEFFSVSQILGFQKIELNHQVDSRMLSGVNFDYVQFSSIHEPCPADIPTHELVKRDWLISAIDEDDRKHGLQAVKKSIDLALQLAAPVVVIHCGSIPFTSDHESKLRSFFKTSKQNYAEYQQLKAQFEQSRKELVQPRLQAVKKSLEELVEYAARCEVKLGLENRYHYMDIPSIDEMDELLGLADPTRLGFIFDVGHAQALDRLGFYSRDEWLERFSSRLFGCHLHDVIGLTDHFAPGLGEIDFNHIATFLPAEAFRTIEILPGNTLAQVSDGLQILAQAGCIQYL